MTKTRLKYVSASELRDVRALLRDGGTYHTLGTHTIYVPSISTKYIDASVVKMWPDLQDQHVLMTPGQAARTELQREFPDLKKVGWRGPSIKLLDKRVPLHYTGPIEGDLIYIDLVGAYHQIYRKLWLDTPYPRGYYGRYRLEPVANRLQTWKAARNAVVGLSRMRTITAVRAEHRMTIQVKNKFLSPPLWATVMDFLHWLAGIAIDCGSIYIHTDGYMFDDQQSADIFMEVLINLGVIFSVRCSGVGEVVSWGNYKIGQRETKSFTLGLNQKSKEFSNVQRKRSEWADYWRRLIIIVRSGDVRGAARTTRRQDNNT